jgi:hypothetical protein
MRRAAAADAGVTGAAAQVGGQCRVKQPLAAVKIRVAGQRRPRLDLETQTPDPDSGFGAMGAGEAGCIGTPAAAVNAAERRPIDMPLSSGLSGGRWPRRAGWPDCPRRRSACPGQGRNTTARSVKN